MSTRLKSDYGYESLMDIDESMHPIEGIDHYIAMQIAAKNQLIWYNTSRYWEPHLDRAQDHWRAVDGLCFDEEEINRYYAEDKVPIQVPIILPKLMSLTGFQRANRRAGIVVPNGIEDAAPADVINRVIKSIRQQNNLDLEESECFMNGVVSGMPAFTFFDVRQSGDGRKAIDIHTEHWNAVLPDPAFSRYTLEDAEYLCRSRVVSLSQAVELFPERAEELKKHSSSSTIHESFLESDILNSESRDLLIKAASDYHEQFERAGLITIIERLHWIRKTMEVYISEYEDEPQIMPPEWSPDRIAEWEAANPTHHKVIMPVRVLFVTTSTAQNVLLENGMHFYQEGRFPCACFIPAMFNNDPKSWVGYLEDSQKMNSIARTEYVHSIRFANDKLMKAKESALTNPEEAVIEKAKTGGVIFLRDDAEMTDVEFVPDQGPNAGYLDLSAVAKDDLDTISSLGPIINGMQESANESKVSADRRIRQMETAQGLLTDHFNLYDIELHRVMLDMIPIVFTEETIFRYVDDMGNLQEQVVNEGQGYNSLTGEASRIVNNLSAGKYDYLQGTEDNSITGREMENEMFMDIVGEILSRTPENTWPLLLQNIPNRLAQQFGQQLAQQEEARQKAEAEGMLNENQGKLNLNIDGRDIIMNHPIINDILKRRGFTIPEQVGAGQLPQLSPGQVNEAQKAQELEGTQEQAEMLAEQMQSEEVPNAS